MPLLEHAAFCNACGTAVRVQAKASRPKVGLVLTTAGPENRLFPGLTPRWPASSRPAGVRTRRRRLPMRRLSTTSGGSKDPRDRFYDEEEGRP